jgi:ANTAR domain
VIVVGERMVDDGAVIGTSGFYVDVTEVIQSDVSTVISDVFASRAGIEQAKGVLMATYGISADRAFEILIRRSQETNIKVRDLAHRFLTALTGRMSTDTRTNVDDALLTLE